MKKILLWTCVIALVAGGSVRAQDAGTQQQLDKLSGQIQDLIDSQAQQSKRIDDIEKEISDLRDKVNTPQTTDYASNDDLKKLAEQVQEVDQKRAADQKEVLEELEKLSKLSTGESHHHSPAPVADNTDNSSPSTTSYEYVVQSGDTLGAIVKAFRAKGVKVTLSQVLKANPGLSANTVYVGKKIYIPDPSAK